jgi:hypothetical protein
MISVANSSDAEVGLQYVRNFDESRAALPSGAWTWENPRPQGNHLYAVFVLAEDDVWVGGHNTLMHWDGNSWQFSQPSWQLSQLSDALTFYVSQIWASDLQHVWALVDRQVLEWNGSSWVSSGLPNPSDHLS